MQGVLIIDKPRGPTSHDIVARVRRALRTRAVGHAGTLDPMATGVLVVAVGEGTKLVRWLTSDDKRYHAIVALGAETDTLDAEGVVVEHAAVPKLDHAIVQRTAQSFVGTHLQVPPLFSAIKIGGEALYERARRGERFDVPAREVTVRRLEIRDVSVARIELELEAAKGFYVRALARDLARALGTRGHLTALRRLASGIFGLRGAVSGALLEQAAAGGVEARARLRASLLSLTDACAAMPRAYLTEQGVRSARHGRPIAFADAAGAEEMASDAEPVALLDGKGALVAVAARRHGGLQVIRGMAGAG